LPWAALGCSGPSESAVPAKAERTDRVVRFGPKLVAPETRCDLGEVELARPYTHAFTLTNSGDEPLRLILARKSCKCADVEIPQDGIPPGEKGRVQIGWAPIPGQYGSYTVAVDLDTNDPQQPRLRLEVRGQVTPVVGIWPEDWSEVDFRQIQPGQVAERELKVFSTRLASFELEATPSHPGLKISTRKLPEGSQAGDHPVRSGYLVTVKTSPELPKGYFRETLLLTVKGEQARQISMPVYGEIETGALRVVPHEVEFKKPKITEADSQKVQVQFLVPSDSERVEVARFEPAFLVIDKPQPLKRGLWQFTVRIPPGDAEAATHQAGGFLEGKIILKTTAPAAPEFPIRMKWVRPDQGP
jgi:hypothetical protein